MKRRHFIQAAMASVLVPASARPCIAALATTWRKRDFIFFDERFQKARRLAASWAAANQLIGVHGDITALWMNDLERMTRRHPVHLRGVTTDSFLFCLRILAGEHASLDVQVSRLDGNLFLWTMDTNPKPET
jgi:hypothetical protein